MCLPNAECVGIYLYNTYRICDPTRCPICSFHSILITKFELWVLSFTKESPFNLRDAGSHVPDHSRVMGALFCIGLLTVGLRLCTFCSLHYHTTIRNMLGLKPFLIGKAVAIWCRMVSGLFSSFFYTRYIRVYLLEYMLYIKVNFIGDPAHWLANQYLAGIRVKHSRWIRVNSRVNLRLGFDFLM